MRIDGDVAHIWRDLEAKSCAQRRYTEWHHRLQDESRAAALRGDMRKSDGFHYWAEIALRAARAERNDPEPRPRYIWEDTETQHLREQDNPQPRDGQWHR